MRTEFRLNHSTAEEAEDHQARGLGTGGNRLFLLGLAIFLLLSVSVTAAFADSEAGAETAGSEASSIPQPEGLAAIERMSESGQATEVATATDPQAAEELPHVDLDRPQAEELLGSVFPSALEGSAKALDELEVEAFHSDYVAVVAPPGGSGSASPGLLSSSLPLLAENDAGEKELVDLDLESVGDRLRPENPLVTVNIPSDLSKGIAFPESEITITVANAETDPTATEPTQSSAFYPNVRTDSDIAISPTPMGIETFTQLRSADSPHREVFDLRLPSGSRLEANGSGGANAINGEGETILSVPAPTARDANGNQVPVSLDVAGNTLTATVEPSADAAFPILLDPMFETYNFTNVPGVGSSDWQGSSNKGFAYRWGSWPGNGMTVEALPGAQTSPGSQALFYYHVPRFYSDAELPTTYIREMQLWGLTYGMPDESGPANTRPAYPFMQLSLWDQRLQQVAAIGTRFGYEGAWTDPTHVFALKNPNENEDVKSGGFAIATYDSVNPPYLRYVNVQQAMVELTDPDSPEFGSTGSVSEWVGSQPGSAINYTAGDRGLGVQKIRVVYPAASGGQGETVTSIKTPDGSAACSGGASLPCPRSTTQETNPISYNPAPMAQGEDWVHLYGVDPVGHTSNSETESRIKVDRTSPELGLSGTLTEQESLGPNKSSYTLSYSANDGDETAASALVPFGAAGTGPGQLERPGGVAIDASGNIWTADTTNNRILEYSPAGKVIREVKSAGGAFTQLNGPRGIAIAPNGTVWVADYGNKRLVAFNFQGSFIREVSQIPNGSSKELEGPYSVAVAGDGSVWVSDIVAHRLRHFSETGTYLGTAPSSTLASVDGLAIDSYGNLWATEYESNKVYEFDSTGHFKFSFGGEGTGNGQFKGILYLAIAPSGNLFAVDSSNNRIQEFRPDGTFLRTFGTTGAANNQLSEPRGVAVAPGNVLIVGDAGNHRLARWQHADKHVESGVAKVEVKVDGVAKKTESPGCSTKDCSLTGTWTMSAQSYSSGKHTIEVLATDAVGNKSTNPPFTVETHAAPPTLALSGTLTEQATLGKTRPRYVLQAEASPNGKTEGAGPPTFISAFGATGSGTGQLNGPRGVASDGKGHVWVVDRANNRVEEFNESGEYITQFGTAGSGNGQFNGPWGIVVTSAGNLWVSDTGNQRLEEFNSKGEFMQKFGTKAPAGSQGTELLSPEGIAVAPGGLIWVADCTGNRIAEFRETVSTESERFVRNAGGTAVSLPNGLAVDGSGNLWATEEGNNKLLEFNSEGAFTRAVGSMGSANGQFLYPAGVGVGPQGYVYVVDLGNNRVEVFNAKGEYLSKFGTTGTANGNFSSPRAIAFGAGGAIFVTDKNNNRVHKWGPPWEGPATFSSVFGTAGSGAGQLSSPRGVAADGKGHVWIVDAVNNRVAEYSEAGNFIEVFGANVNKTKVEAGGTEAEKNLCTAASGNTCQPGTAGTANGQLNGPWGVTVTAAGNVWVADAGNARFEEFNPKGEFMQKFGTRGTSSKGTEFLEPEGIVAASGGMLWVSDSLGHRVAEVRETVLSESERFVRNATGAGLLKPIGLSLDASGDVLVADEEADKVLQFSSEGIYQQSIGSGAGSGAGQLSGPTSVAVAPSGRIYALDRDNNRVEVFGPKGEYVTAFGTLGTGNGNFSSPRAIAFGSGGAIFVTDKGNNRVHKWMQAEAPDSISTIEVKVDGKVVGAPEACLRVNCTSAKQWTLNSPEYLGAHSITVTATTAAGFTTTKTLSVNEQRDETKPTIQTGGELANAPEGWVEQESYGFLATGADPGGSGVTSLVFKIDGSPVLSNTQGCSDGGCEASIAKGINMAPYAGGAHNAEVVATDGAGNSSTERWTINVDPEGHISTQEATDTLEAVETTTDANLVGPSEEEELEGTAEGLRFRPIEGEGYVVEGGAAPATVSADPAGGVSVEIPTEDAFESVCESKLGGEVTGAEEEALSENPSCTPIAEGETPDLAPITISPSTTSEQASVVVADSEAATVAVNQEQNVDLLTRPLYDGTMTFAAIRDSSGPTQYSWVMELEEEQELELIDPQHARVVYPEGHTAFSITVVPARDAIGSAVPTSLAVAGDVLTLTVDHRRESPTGGAYVYPVVAGTGWEGGFEVYHVEMPPPTEQEPSREEEVSIAEAGSIAIAAYGPPEKARPGAPGWDYEPRSQEPYERRYKFTYCWPKHIPGDPLPPGKFDSGIGPEGDERANITPMASECHREDYHGIHWGVTVHGHYEYKTHNWVNVQQADCDHWGEEQPTTLNCKLLPTGRTSGPANVLGEYRFHEAKGDWGWDEKPTCLVFGGEIYPREAPEQPKPYERPLVWLPKALTDHNEKCNWEAYEREAIR